MFVLSLYFAVMERRPYTFDRVVRIVLTAIGIIGTLYLINRLKDALLPFLVAWLLAYLIQPLVQFIQFKMKVRNRMLAILCTLLFIGAFFSLLGWIFIPSVLSEMDKMKVLIRNFLAHSDYVVSLPVSWQEYIREKVDIQQLTNTFNSEEFIKFVENALGKIWFVLTGSVNQIITIISWFIVLLYLVFILLDYDKILLGFKNLIPEKFRPMVLGILSDVESSMNRYFRGQSLIAFCVGILFSIGFVIVGLPLAIPLGLFIGLLNMVPYLQVVGFIPTILLCLLHSFETGGNFWFIFAGALVVFIVVQLIQDMYLTPRIMGKVTGLNPAIILLSLSIWGSLMGVIGMIIALPLTTLMLSYYQRYILDAYATRKTAELKQNNESVEK